MSDTPHGRLEGSVRKAHGDGVLVSGDEYARAPRQGIPWSPTFDMILSGPVEEGSWVGVSGPEKMTKTTSILSFCANAQRPEYGARPVYYAKAEGRLSAVHLRGIRGLDLSPGRFNIIQSVEGNILSTQAFLNILVEVIRSVPGAVVVIDSISAFSDDKELAEGVGAETRGGGAKLFGQFCRLVNQVVPINRTIVFGVTHRISNTSGWGAGETEKGARMWRYQRDYSLRAVSKKAWLAGERQVGLEVEWLCETSKNGPPGMKGVSYFRFGTGTDRLYELIDFAAGIGLVRKAGSWLHLDYLGGEPPKFLGVGKLYEALQDRPEWAESLRRRVMEMAGVAA